ncbi:hypothetical protein ACIPW5_13255 [Streptomyces sp. NPDC090077]|uniref:hypothetical protein n=1 Tax=Streptomyces sp. NPDC090077 TaxID=3365938 RepID=UPI0038298668
MFPVSAAVAATGGAGGRDGRHPHRPMAPPGPLRVGVACAAQPGVREELGQGDGYPVRPAAAEAESSAPGAVSQPQARWSAYLFRRLFLGALGPPGPSCPDTVQDHS